MGILERVKKYIKEVWNDLDQTPDWLVPRDGWGASMARPDMDPMDFLYEVKPDSLPWPLKWVVVHKAHNYEDPGSDPERIRRTLREMQEDDMDEDECEDIRYNFVVAGDGKVYEGRGWNKPGHHTHGYNDNGIGLAFLGDFEEKMPSEEMLTAARRLVEEGMRKRYLRGDVQVVPHSQVVEGARCPDKQLREAMERDQILEPDRNVAEWSWLWTMKRWMDDLPELMADRLRMKMKEWKSDWMHSGYRGFFNYIWNN